MSWIIHICTQTDYFALTPITGTSYFFMAWHTVCVLFPCWPAKHTCTYIKLCTLKTYWGMSNQQFMQYFTGDIFCKSVRPLWLQMKDEDTSTSSWLLPLCVCICMCIVLSVVICAGLRVPSVLALFSAGVFTDSDTVCVILISSDHNLIGAHWLCRWPSMKRPPDFIAHSCSWKIACLQQCQCFHFLPTKHKPHYFSTGTKNRVQRSCFSWSLHETFRV